MHDLACCGQVSKESCRPVVRLEEENYMFRLSAFQERLLKWIQTDGETNSTQLTLSVNATTNLLSNYMFISSTIIVLVIHPPNYSESVKQHILNHNRDLSVSRLRSKQPWGIGVPGDDSHTVGPLFLLSILTYC